MLIPAKDDKNYKAEMERRKNDPKAFGVYSAAGVKIDETKDTLVTDVTHWARECVKHSKTEIADMLPSCTREHVQALLAVETRKDVIELLTKSLTTK